MMSHDFEHFDTMLQLAADFVEDRLSEDEQHRLNELIQTDPQALQFFMDYVEVHALIEWQYGMVSPTSVSETEIEDKTFFLEVIDSELKKAKQLSEESARMRMIALEQLNRKKKQKVKVSLESKSPKNRNGTVFSFAGFNVVRSSGKYDSSSFGAVGKLAAMLVLSALVWFVWSWFSPPQEPLPIAIKPVIPQTVVVGTITDEYHTRWEGASPHYMIADQLLADQALTLSEGWVELTLDRGAKVVVEAPATFTLLDDNKMHLAQGRMTARVNERSSGFAVSTTYGLLTDMGTEFGVQLSDDHGLLASVFEGEITYSSSDNKSSKPLRVTAEQEVIQSSMRDSQPQVQARSESSPVFIRAIPQNDYEVAVRRSKPVGYWRFTSDQNEKIINCVDSAKRIGIRKGPSTLGQSCLPLGGRSPVALRLEDKQSTVTWSKTNPLTIDQQSYSIALWIRIDQSGAANILSATTDLGPDARFSSRLMVNADGHFTFYNYCPKDLNRTSSPGRLFTVAKHPLETGKWYHLVGTARGGGEAKLYVNGVEAAVPTKLFSFIETRYPDFVLGGSAGRKQSPRHHADGMVGTVAELTIYDRELPSDEVAKLYQTSELRNHS